MITLLVYDKLLYSDDILTQCLCQVEDVPVNWLKKESTWFAKRSHLTGIVFSAKRYCQIAEKKQASVYVY